MQAGSVLTTFHLGIVFILLGFILIFSSMIPTSIIKVSHSTTLAVILFSPSIGTCYSTVGVKYSGEMAAMDYVSQTVLQADWSRLLGVGVAFIFIGLIMVMVNRIITAREEEQLSRYVKQRLEGGRAGAGPHNRGQFSSSLCDRSPN